MLTRLRLAAWKSFANAELRLGRRNALFGGCGAGKSNLLDALRVLSGIGHELSIDEILNGRLGALPRLGDSDPYEMRSWEGIRGGSRLVARMASRAPTTSASAVELQVGLGILGKARAARRKPAHEPPSENEGAAYRIVFHPEHEAVLGESLLFEGKEVFDSAPIANDPESPFFEVRYFPGTKGGRPHLKFEKSRPVLSQLARHPECSSRHRAVLRDVLASLSRVRVFDAPESGPGPRRLSGSGGRATGDPGRDLASSVASLLSKPKAGDFRGFVAKALRGQSLVLTNTMGELKVALQDDTQSGGAFEASVLAKGALRFLAVAAAIFQAGPADLLAIDDIESDLPPSLARRLVELLHVTSEAGTQVLFTTRVPIALAWLAEEDYKTTWLVKREEGGGSTVTSLDTDPGFAALVARQPIGGLFADGWLEGAL